jgi:hypothetical protein
MLYLYLFLVDLVLDTVFILSRPPSGELVFSQQKDDGLFKLNLPVKTDIWFGVTRQ